ncbi:MULTISPECIES: FomB family phosphonate monophosphate kinase [Streptomyces]|uniref:FomB family phosphonate monophosphate kinase n=1 Tax=Streptomyces TaxID=1883 RepID=UPI00068D09D5|nr:MULTISPECIES: FomB family phosphonate monophosphate kinase [Streptomyces]MDN3053605.1 FomB family phosphonate monophosphate kinase [Streptomyces sp. SRF1]
MTVSGTETPTAASGDDVENLLGGQYTLRSSAVVDLNLFRVRISSNLTEFDGYSYFTRFVDPSVPGRVDYEVVCVDLDADPVDERIVSSLRDRTFRADRFRGGFYLTHHHGAPAHLVTRGNRIYVFGRRLDRVIWPYFTKHLLTVFAVDHDLLHLKAAAFIQPGSGANLLFGRGSGGKTVFLTQACVDGGTFLSNTHVLVDGLTVHGIPSAMRVRHDRCFGELIDSAGLAPHLEASEYRVDPALLFDHQPPAQATVRNLCIIDYDADRPRRFEEMDVEPFAAFLDLFAFAIGTYGLKDDVLAHLGNDVLAYGAAFSAMKTRMLELIASCRRLYINADMLDPGVRRETLAALAG